jgi:hypothetical protein
MDWNIFIKRSLIRLLIAAGIGYAAYLLYRSVGIHTIFNWLLMVIGFFIGLWLFILVTKFLSVCFQNNFILTMLFILGLAYMAIHYQVFNNNPYLNGSIEKFQEFQQNYNNEMDELDKLLKNQIVSPEAGEGQIKLPKEF